MCLITYEKEPSIAKEDIICYKVYIDNRTSIISPYQKDPIPEIITAEVPIFYKSYPIQILKRCQQDLPPLYAVDYGFHSFFLRKDAENFASCFKHSKLYKCVIPKGSKYYYGSFSYNAGSYCSNQIKILELLTSFDKSDEFDLTF